MLKSDKYQDVVDLLLTENVEFKELYEEHIQLEQDVEALYSLKYFPPEVENRLKEIKVSKLRGKDRMWQIILSYKK